MIRARRLLSLGIAAVLSGLPESSLAQEEKLRHDLFARPALTGMQRVSPPAAGGPTAAEPRRKFKLQAVMVAGPSSIANVDGVMVRIGDEVHGYRLVEVHERRAVFEKNKTRFTVSVQSDGPARAREGQ